MKLITTGIILLCILFSLSAAYASPDGTKIIYGYVEKVNVQPENITMTTKLDTGALTASLNAINIKEYVNNGKKWVSFDLPITDTTVGETELIHFEKQLKRTAKLKQRLIPGVTNSSQLSYRPVIMMEICIKQQCKTVEVNLSNRTNFIYPLLLGRKAIIAFDAIVDPSQQYIQTNQFDYEKDELQDVQ